MKTKKINKSFSIALFVIILLPVAAVLNLIDWVREEWEIWDRITSQEK